MYWNSNIRECGVCCGKSHGGLSFRRQWPRVPNFRHFLVSSTAIRFSVRVPVGVGQVLSEGSGRCRPSFRDYARSHITDARKESTVKWSSKRGSPPDLRHCAYRQCNGNRHVPVSLLIRTRRHDSACVYVLYVIRWLVAASRTKVFTVQCVTWQLSIPG
jgi:hypothetical protein